MAIEAPLSKHSKTNYKLGILLFLGMAVIFAYDGYLSQYEWSYRRDFYEEHSKVLLFRVNADVQRDLDGGLVSQELRQKFEEANIALSDGATVSPGEAGPQWVIADQAKKYSLWKEEPGLAVYAEGPDDTMMFNRVSPFFLAAAAVVLIVWFRSRKNIKLVADENELVIAGRKKIPYDSIEKIDKTYFETKGFFTITYTDEKGASVQRKVSDRQFDNLGPILDHLVAQLS